MTEKLKDGGMRRVFETGAVRDLANGKGRFDLMPGAAMALIARQLERGAKKYGERNWEKGQPFSVFLDSATRHLTKLGMGFDDEDHLAAALWNLACLAEGRQRTIAGLWSAELDDLPKTWAGKEPWF